MIKVHEYGIPIYVNEDAIEIFSKHYNGKTAVDFISGSSSLINIDETPDEIYELILEERRKMYSDFYTEPHRTGQGVVLC